MTGAACPGRTVAAAAVRQDGLALHLLSPEMQNDRAVVMLGAALWAASRALCCAQRLFADRRASLPQTRKPFAGSQRLTRLAWQCSTQQPRCVLHLGWCHLPAQQHAEPPEPPSQLRGDRQVGWAAVNKDGPALQAWLAHRRAPTAAAARIQCADHLQLPCADCCPGAACVPTTSSCLPADSQLPCATARSFSRAR